MKQWLARKLEGKRLLLLDLCLVPVWCSLWVLLALGLLSLSWGLGGCASWPAPPSAKDRMLVGSLMTVLLVCILHMMRLLLPGIRQIARGICARIKGHYLAWRDGLVARFKHTPSQSSPDEALMGVGQSDVLVVGSEMVFRDSSGNILATAPFSNYSTGTTLVDPQGGTYTVSSKDGRLRATIDGDCIVRWCFKLTEHEVVNGRGFEHGYIRVMDEATREDIRADEEATQRIYRERNDELRASLGMPRLWSP